MEIERIIIVLGIYFYNSGNTPTPLKNCVNQGENFDSTGEQNPKECCAGLEDVHTSDSVSVADKCYWTGKESGSPIITCSDCGNEICEDTESVCGCEEDCVGKGKSTYQTVQEFCINGFNRYCNNIPEGMNLDLCNLCE